MWNAVEQENERVVRCYRTQYDIGRGETDMACSAGSRIIPSSSEPLRAMLHIQDEKKPWSPWDFYVGDSKQYHRYGVSTSELGKLPGYPITRLNCPRGIEVTLKHGDHTCRASFHGYDESARGGRHIYIGSRGREGREFTELYRCFLGRFGVKVGADTRPMPVGLDFRDGHVVHVSHGSVHQ